MHIECIFLLSSRWVLLKQQHHSKCRGWQKIRSDLHYHGQLSEEAEQVPVHDEPRTNVCTYKTNEGT